MKIHNLIFSVALTILLAIFCATPNQTILASVDYQAVSTWESKKIIKSLPKELYKNWEKRKINVENNLNVTTIALLKEILRKDARDYMLHELPIDISINVISETIDISRIIISGDVASVIKKIEKDSVNFAVSYLNDYFNKGKAKVGYGAIDVNYNTSFGNTNTIIQYIILLKEIDDNKSEVVMRIYSPKKIIPPESYKGYGIIEGFLNELNPGDAIPSFIIEIRGIIRKSSMGEYGWNNSPKINLVFSENVPDFGLRPPSLVEKYVIAPIQEKIKEIGGIFSFLGGNTEFVEVITGGREDKELIDEELVSMGGEEKAVPISCSKSNLGLPLHKVIINEVAWMGTHNSANDEWIELKNISGKDINMKGWSLVDKTSQINITFGDLIIKNGDFLLLERVSDNTIPFINADLIYTGVLGNTDDELHLFNNQCVLEDYVIASPSWPAGNSSQRRTMERTANLNWQTYGGEAYYNILGTPKRENSVKEAIEVKEEVKEVVKEEVKEEVKEKVEEVKEEVKEEEVAINYCPQVGTPSHSGVIINEVAWMGTTVGATKEWIELKNISTSPINLDGWQLLDKDNQIKIVFNKDDFLMPGQLYLLERTDDDSVSGVVADKIYSGNLSNTNESLRLFNSSCQLIDEVVASSNWPAGNSSERRTMERSSDLNWHTSFSVNGSPKAENSQPALTSNSNNNQNTTTIIYASSPAPEETITYCSQNGTPTYGGIIINEVAWMGTTVGATKEWIELKNTSEEEVLLGGWQLLSKDNRIKIIFDDDELLGPNQFYLLERTSDDSVPDIPADKIYTGALGNSSDSLMLFNNQCQLIDEVLANPEWIAGNSTERKTMERDSDLNWYTSSVVDGTPRAENSAKEEIEEEEEIEEGDHPEEETEDVVIENNNYLVISEIQVNGEDNLEYIELYNQSEEEINFCDDEDDCFYLSYFAPTFNLDGSPKYNWNNPYYNWKLEGSISPGEYYLIIIHGNIDGDMIAKTKDDIPYSSAIINNSMGSFALFSSNPIIEDEELEEGYKIEQAKLLKIDAVGWGNNDLPVKECEATSAGDGSIGRKWLDGKYVDSDNNLNDFQLQKPSPGEYAKQPPEKIENIEVGGNKNTITLSWLAPYDPDSPVEEIEYEIYSSLDADNFESLGDINIERSNNQNFALIENLYYEKDYYFKIKAIDIDDNESDFSDEAYFKTFASNHISPLPYGNYQKSNIFELPIITGEWSTESLEVTIEEDAGATFFAFKSLIGDGELIYLSATYQGYRRIIAIKDGEIIWSYKCDGNAELFFLGKDGTIYASDGSSIFALSPSGKLKWKEIFNSFAIQSIAVDSQERIYFISDSKIYFLEDKNNEASYEIINEFDNFEISAPIVVDSNDNIYFSNGDVLFKAKYDLGIIGQKSIEPIYDDEYPGEKNKRTIIEQIKLTNNDRILLKVRNHYYNKDSREITMNSLLSSIDGEIIWTKDSYSGIEAIIDDQFFTWDNSQYSLYGISIETGEILWNKKFLNYDFFYLIADYNKNVYLIRYSSLEGYNIDSITNDAPDNGLILKALIGERSPYFSIGESGIYFSCYKKFKSLSY